MTDYETGDVNAKDHTEKYSSEVCHDEGRRDPHRTLFLAVIAQAVMDYDDAGDNDPHGAKAWLEGHSPKLYQVCWNAGIDVEYLKRKLGITF